MTNSVPYIFCLIFLTFHLTAKEVPETRPFGVSTMGVDRTFWDGNRINNAHGNNGEIVSYFVTSESGLEWPKGSGKHAVFQSGLWLGASIVNGVEDIRTATTVYKSEYVPGNWGRDPEDPDYRIYTIDVDDGPTSANWHDWPVDQGAPWVDVNGDGFYDPFVDHPNIIGDKYQWYVMNDGNDSLHHELYGTEPLGVEVQVSLFGFDHTGPMGNTLFMKFKIINAGSNDLDSMFVSLWSEFDLGQYTDDYVGCDPELNLGFGYNDFDGDMVYGDAPPAVGYVFLQTPIVSSQGDTAWVSGELIQDFKNIPMNAFTKYASGDPDHLPWTAQEVLWNMNGLNENTGQPFIDPTNGEPSPFVFNGDPVTGVGWVDYNHGVPEGNRQFLMSAGPFSMAPGDTQEVVSAIILAQGANNLLSIAALRDYVQWVNDAWRSNFTNMGPGAEIEELSVPHNTEEIGPFKIVLGFERNPDWEPKITSVSLHYGIGEVQDSVVMLDTIYNEMNAYFGTIPSFPDVTGTTELRYYASVEYDDGTQILLPYGAPFNYTPMIFGPDTTAPVLTNLKDLPDVIYLMDNEREISVNISDDRFPISSATAKWKVNSTGNIQEAPMQEDDDLWVGNITWQDLKLGDTVYYWIEAVDSSMNQNVGVSEVTWFVAKEYEMIGNWDEEILNEWDWGTFWSIGAEGDYINIAQLYVSLQEGEGDTLTRLNPLKITEEFPSAFLLFEHSYVFIEPNKGYLEVKVDDGEWQSVRTYDSNQPEFDNELISLDSFIGTDSLFLRFRAEGHGGIGGVIWKIDDVRFAIDSLLASDDVELTLIPFEYNLYQNYPNPFNPTTTIGFTLPHPANVELVIYDILGREVERLIDEQLEAGLHHALWNASNVASGIYFYQLSARSPGKSADYVKTKKLILLR